MLNPTPVRPMDTSNPYHVNEQVHRPAKKLLADNMVAQRAHPHVIKDMRILAWWNVRTKRPEWQLSGGSIRPLAQCNKFVHFKRTNQIHPKTCTLTWLSTGVLMCS